MSPPGWYGLIEFRATVAGAYLDDLQAEWFFEATDLLDVRGTVKVHDLELVQGDEPAGENIPKVERDRIKALIGLYGLRLRATLNRAMESEKTEREEA